MPKVVSLSKEMESKVVKAGILKKVPTSGLELLLEEYTYEEGAAAPHHTHGCEQVGYIIAGQLEMTLAGQKFVLGPGDCYLVPEGMEHDVKALTKAKTVLISSIDDHDHHEHDHDHEHHGHDHEHEARH